MLHISLNSLEMLCDKLSQGKLNSCVKNLIRNADFEQSCWHTTTLCWWLYDYVAL